MDEIQDSDKENMDKMSDMIKKNIRTDQAFSKNND